LTFSAVLLHNLDSTAGSFFYCRFALLNCNRNQFAPCMLICISVLRQFWFMLTAIPNEAISFKLTCWLYRCISNGDYCHLMYVTMVFYTACEIYYKPVMSLLCFALNSYNMLQNSLYFFSVFFVCFFFNKMKITIYQSLLHCIALWFCCVALVDLWSLWDFVL
jgi:hypothetical protein